MTEFEACYFCGVVENVERQPVLENGPTVALCPECADRLDRVVETIRREPSRPDTGDGGATIPGDSGDGADPDAGDGPAEPADDKSVVVGDETPDEQGVTVESDTAATDRPEGYGKVLRFLRNRELPVARDTVVELAANAYDLRRDQVGEALDYAVDTGVLVESDGEIDRA